MRKKAKSEKQNNSSLRIHIDLEKKLTKTWETNFESKVVHPMGIDMGYREPKYRPNSPCGAGIL